MSRSTRSADRIFAEPGPLDDEATNCDHCPTLDPEEGVYRVPDPNFGVGSVAALCPYHLSVLARDHATVWGRLKATDEYGDVERYRQQGALVERGDLPEELSHSGTLYQRFGLDETGRAYFICETGSGYRLIETDQEFDALESTTTSRGRLLGLLDHVEKHVGWRGLANEWVDRAFDEADDEVRS